MAQNVRFVQTTKQRWLDRDTYDPSALYFCMDTGEIFKGNVLFTEGVKIVPTRDALPSFECAADGVVYYVADTKAGFMISPDRAGWLQTIYAPVADVSSIPEGEEYNVVTTVGAVRDIETQIYEYIDGLTTSVKIADEAHGLVFVDGEMSINLATSTSDGAMSKEDKTKLDAIPTVYMAREYEVSNKPDGTLVNYRDKEIRIMCPADTAWEIQNSGENANPNMYYIGFKAYAPRGAMSFKEDLAETIADDTMYYFSDNDFAGVDEYGRKYSVVWLPVAVNKDGAWTYYGENSSVGKYIGWFYSVEWYGADGKMIASDCIRINLSNDSCHNAVEPYYMAGVIKGVRVNGEMVDTVDGIVDIAIAEQTLGVKASEEITIAEDGTLGIGKVSLSKIDQDEDDDTVIIMTGGSSQE